VLLAALLAGACSTDGVAPSADLHPQLDRPFTLKIGQSAVLDEPPLVITFTDVPHDSRCPVDVVCVWAGDAVVRLALHVGPGDGRGPDLIADLHADMEPRSAPWGPYYELRLLALRPEPRVTAPPPEAYRATLVVESR
jgi:hypothetical protein